jgi:hypothetical protein
MVQSGLDESVPLAYILGHGHIGYFFDQQVRPGCIAEEPLRLDESPRISSVP